MGGPDPAVAATRLAVRGCLADEWVRPGPVVVACSGGADSLALVAATVFECRRDGRRVIGATVDHGLQDGSSAHAERVVGQMSALGVTETLTARVSVEPAGRGVEAAAREARYAVLEEVARRFGCSVVLLGHTLDDQAETALLGLTRGSGGRSIAGMRRVVDGPDVSFLRPFLDLTRTQTEQACRAQGLEFWSDPHNSDPRFTRARVRHRVLPVLEEELGPGVAVTLARTADLLREDMELLDRLAGAAYDEARTDDGGLAAPAMRAQPRALSARVLRRAAVDAGSPPAELTKGHVDALVQLMQGAHAAGPAALVQLPGHVTAYLDADRTIRFRRT